MSKGRHTQKNNKENNNNKGKIDEKSPNKYEPLGVGGGTATLVDRPLRNHLFVWVSSQRWYS